MKVVEGSDGWFLHKSPAPPGYAFRILSAAGAAVESKSNVRGVMCRRNVERELINHKTLLHPNIIRFKEVFVTSTHLGIVMEYAAGGELFDRIVKAGRFSEDEARYFFQQLISGVEFCHSQVRPSRSLLTRWPMHVVPLAKVPTLRTSPLLSARRSGMDAARARYDERSPAVMVAVMLWSFPGSGEGCALGQALHPATFFAQG